LNALGKLELPIVALNEEQVNALLSEIIEREGKFSDTGNGWLIKSTTFTADVQSTIIGVLAATGVSCYKTIKSKLLK